jgi:hypothetical protein
MIIPLDKLESKIIFHSDYQHRSVSKYETCTNIENRETYPIFEEQTFGNPYDFTKGYFNEPEFVVWFGVYPEGKITDVLPDKAYKFDQDTEPTEDKNLFVAWAVFKTLEDAYQYAISKK